MRPLQLILMSAHLVQGTAYAQAFREIDILVLPLIDEILESLFERISKGLILLECMLQSGVQAALELQQQLHHVLVL